MRKNRIRLTESQLHRVIKKSVKKVLNETVYGEVGNLPINIGGFIIKTSGEGIVAVSEMDNDHYITLGDSLDTISLQDAIDTISEMLSY